MSKNKDQKRKTQLEQKAKNESFKFQVKYAKKTRMPELPDDDANLNAELEALCEAGLGETMLTLGEIIRGAKKELGIEQIAEKNTLNGSLVAYILGITEINPIEMGALGQALAKAENIEMPMQVVMFYDNEVRNKVVEWIKSKYEGMSTRLGSPVLKLKNMVVEFNRVVK